MFRSRSTSEDTAVDAVQVLRELPLHSILPNPAQPRRRFDEVELRELADSLSECGVLAPVLVRPLADGSYQLVAGERRWRAARLAGLASIPALVSRYDDRAALEVGLIENMARKDLNPVEQARVCATLANELGLSLRQIGRRVGCQRSLVWHLIGLLELPGEVLELLERGELSRSHGMALRKVKDLDARLALARAAVEQEWSLETLDRHARCSEANAPAPDRSGGEQVAPDQGQEQDPIALSLARAWGDLLGAEVHARPLPRRRLRIEVLFGSAAEGIALADRFAAAIARGAKGR
jgi:ParB family chromosome partitioning protein